jgi:hypothetical protein
VGLGINLALLGILVFLGVKARNGKKWALITGLILYGLDVLIMIWAGDIFSIIFHALALFGLFQGLQAIRKIQELENKGPQRLQQF